uniref:LRRC37A/B like protein 1 C-terminal domain-containing protein n=1 Tax=Catharus ustulatus TaxID=91951 RepID=A0A8C3U5D0_CATUS
MEMEEPRKLNRSPVLSLKPKEPSMGDHGTVTLAVALTLSTEGDGSGLENSRTSSYPPRHLLGHKGKTRVDDLRTKLKKKLHKAEGIKTVKSIVPHHSQPANLKYVLEKTPSSWDHRQQDSRLNWQALNPWDVAGGLNPSHDKSGDRHLRDEVEDQDPRQNYVSSHKQPKKEDSQLWVGHNQLFYEVLSPVKAEGEPRATATKAEQGLNRNLDFLSDPLVQSHPSASSRGQTTAEGVHSPLGGHPQKIPDTTEDEGSQFLNNPWRPQSPGFEPVPGESFETTVNHHLRLLVPDKGLQSFMAHMEQALRMDCSLPQLKQACAKMVSKTGLLLKALSERQEKQGASDHMDLCRQQENMPGCMALGEGKKLVGKKAEHSVEMVKFVVLLSLFVILGVMLKVFFHTCLVSSKADSQPGHTRILCLRRFCVKLPEKGRKDNKEAHDVEQNGAGCSCKCCPCCGTVHGSSQWSSLFTNSELPWIERIRDAYEAQREASQEEA